MFRSKLYYEKENSKYIDHGNGHYVRCLIYENAIPAKEVKKYE